MNLWERLFIVSQVQCERYYNMAEKEPFSTKSPLDTGDRRVPLPDEVNIKTELMARRFNQLIESFHSATSVEDRAKLQKKIHQIAKNIHDTSISNEP